MVRSIDRAYGQNRAGKSPARSRESGPADTGAASNLGQGHGGWVNGGTRGNLAGDPRALSIGEPGQKFRRMRVQAVQTSSASPVQNTEPGGQLLVFTFE
jgi:hypothetical protein